MLQKRKGFDHKAAALGTVLFGPAGCGLGALTDTSKPSETSHTTPRLKDLSKTTQD